MSFLSTPRMAIRTPHRVVELGGRTRLMGILNMTLDSFSDGGRFVTGPAGGIELDAAVAAARRMAEDGAEFIDIGGESTRPGSREASPDEQCRRVIPVIEAIRAAGIDAAISIDTRSAGVADAALAAGADIVNDISALRHDPRMAEVCARRGAAVILMHMQGTPETMQVNPTYSDVVAEVADFLRERVDAASAAGIGRDRLLIDPGIGFGKTHEHNLALLRHIDALHALQSPVIVGPSRKAFLGAIVGETDPARRDLATAATVALCAAAGVQIVRVHNAAMMKQVTSVCTAVLGEGNLP